MFVWGLALFSQAGQAADFLRYLDVVVHIFEVFAACTHGKYRYRIASVGECGESETCFVVQDVEYYCRKVVELLVECLLRAIAFVGFQFAEAVEHASFFHFVDVDMRPETEFVG